MFNKNCLVCKFSHLNYGEPEYPLRTVNNHDSMSVLNVGQSTHTHLRVKSLFLFSFITRNTTITDLFISSLSTVLSVILYCCDCIWPLGGCSLQQKCGLYSDYCTSQSYNHRSMRWSVHCSSDASYINRSTHPDETMTWHGRIVPPNFILFLLYL